MVDLSEYKQLYLKTATEYLHDLQSNLTLYIADQTNAGALEILHRSAHSLKSQSLVMGYMGTGLLSKELEYIYRAIKDKKLTMSDQLSAALAEAQQKLYDSIESIKTNDKEIELATNKWYLETITKIKSE